LRIFPVYSPANSVDKSEKAGIRGINRASHAKHGLDLRLKQKSKEMYKTMAILPEKFEARSGDRNMVRK